MTLDCTKKSLLKLARYKLAKLNDKHEQAPVQQEQKPMDLASIQKDGEENIDLDDITAFLENDVALDPCL
jgi:hypothetical protein